MSQNLSVLFRHISLFLALFAFALSGFSQTLVSKIPSKRLERRPILLGESLTFPSNVLDEDRTLNFYLPSTYDQDTMAAYPVIYLLDGGMTEDFVHVAGLVQFATFPWVKMLPECILVGIANVDRKRDFTFPTTIEKDKQDFPTTGGSAKFIRFLKEEVIPMAQANYRADPNTRVLIGQSLGGLLATEVLFTKPEMFSHYIIVSPSMWWDNESLLAQEPAFGAPTFKDSISVTVAVGKEGRWMERGAKMLSALVQKHGPASLKSYFLYLDDQDHANIMHLALYQAFELMFAKSEEKPK
ncbi:MAG: alpha/beta hydrolase-fold protein [Bacteroidota bacterium]